MKKLAAIPLIFLCLFTHAQFFKKLGDKVKDKVNQRVDNKTDAAIDKGLDKTEEATKNGTKGTTGSASNNNSSNTPAATNSDASQQASQPQSLKTYQNYDFVPGDTVLFEDHFTDDQDGEFPSHWELKNGQGVVNKSEGISRFSILNGNYARMAPRMKNTNYLTDNFTVELDYFANNGADCGYGTMVFFVNNEDDSKAINLGRYKSASSDYFPNGTGINGTEVKQSDEDFWNHWHHFAIAYKKPQMKVYVDQTRVLVIPDITFTPLSLQFGGAAGGDECPNSIANVRIASGGRMNMIGKKFTESKIVTHGINFDIDKAGIKPESMGTLNMIVKVLNESPGLKFEIDGHTDNSGTPAHNLTLSQQRADAVKVQLVSMGIDASRLTTKGFGDTKPISDNDSIEGKANNRRVEFVKQ